MEKTQIHEKNDFHIISIIKSWNMKFVMMS
jgi:hypothetical protein